MANTKTDVISKLQRIGLILLWCYIGLGMFKGWVWGLDTFTLVLHEAGHPIVGMISSRLMVYGGTIFQLLFPILTYYHFKKQNDLLGRWGAVLWLAASIRNTGVYMADARAKALPLIGGLDPELYHDWSEILSRWHLLNADTFLGGTIQLTGWLIWLWIGVKIGTARTQDTEGSSRLGK